MNSRLFWKILLAFWLTHFLAAMGIIVTLAVMTHRGLGWIVRLWTDQHFPLWPFWVNFAAGFVVSALLAAYLARPISHLRAGFRSLSFGELGTRLTPRMGRRRDEIADLARDFDAMAERLQQLVDSRDRLLHDVSHELRSPLARLSLAVALARKNGELGDQAFARLEAETARLNAIVGDLLSLARAESDAAAEEVYVDIGDLLRAICADTGFEAEPRQVTVRLMLDAVFEDPSHAPLVAGAPELLRRALENVIRNAIRFSPAGKMVQVQAGAEPGQVVIEVRDEGPGAPPALLATLFDPFVKGPGEAHGVGLGLAIARRAVAAHRGQLDAANLAGGGFRIRLTLPVHAPTIAAG